MKGYLLDTNVVSELRKGDRGSRNLVEWYRQRDKRELFLSVITLAEIRLGIVLVQRRDLPTRVPGKSVVIAQKPLIWLLCGLCQASPFFVTPLPFPASWLGDQGRCSGPMGISYNLKP